MGDTRAFGVGGTQLLGTPAPPAQGSPAERSAAAVPSASTSPSPRTNEATPPAGASPPAPTARNQTLIGRNLGHFRIDRLIAEGGMGEVYRGYDTSLGRAVAIKIIRPELAADPRFLQIFLREAQAQANVVHSHVLQAYYVGEEGGVWFLAMQLVEGGSLEEALNRGERLSWKDAARHLMAVAEGLEETARLGIVHRDIKPANILLDRRGDAHLADFGLATSTGLLSSLGQPALGPNTRKPGTTQPGAIMGTLEYMPPEQLHARVVDERTDIYALGATFYQLMAGRLPYPIVSVETATAAERGPPAPPLASLCPEAPRAFCELIDRCLARDPNDRPKDHATLLQLLKKVAPRPEITPSPLARLLSLLLDLVPFGLVFPYTYLRLPGLAFALMATLVLVGIHFLSATPGQWLMRLWLRGRNGADVPLWRGALRSGLQLGWLLPGSLFLSLAYVDSGLSVPLGILAAAWALASAVTSLPALGKTRQTLADRLTDTRVLVALE